MGTVADNLLDAVDILIDNKVTDLQFNKTIRGKIAEVIDESIGQYKIQYQNSYFTAYSSDSNATYTKGTDVYVEILSSDFEKNAVILGTVRRLGSNYITIIEKLDRYYEIGPKQGEQLETIGLCSYAGSQIIPVQLNLDALNMREAAAAADSLQVAMTIKTTLDSKQRAGGGNYGLKIKANYYDAAYVSQDQAEIIEREYIFDINDMLGQPYKYTTPSNQYTIFPIDAKNFIEITSIEAFCKDFPYQEENQSNDIFFSNIYFQFLHTLSDEELANTSLKITTPLGGYFSVGNTGDKILHADLRIRGKKVNYSTQQIDFYWFKRNLEVDANDSRFSSYGGNGWECLNKMGGGSFLPASYEYVIKEKSFDSEGHEIENYPSQETQFKCVVVFIESGQSIALSSTIVFKNLTKDLKFKITSTSGTIFSFNIGLTTLELIADNFTPTETTQYCWTESVDGGASNYFNGNKFINDNKIDVAISTPAARLLTYECAVYDNGILLGTASITLVNNYESLNYTLVIKDSQQIFKYDSYGVSPAAPAKAAADRMTIPILSFDIYDKQGQVIDIPDADKNKYMNIRWVWPTPVGDLIDDEMVASWSNCRSKNTTMLTTTETEMKVVELRNIVNNSSTPRFVLENRPTFTYGILDRYNATYANTDSSRNNIRLEVEYQGEFLSATTNFTFTKEGELGTNGTKYVARIVPKYQEIFLREGIEYASIYGVSQNGQTYTFENFGKSKSINEIFGAELWDGGFNVIDNAIVTWSIASSTNRHIAKPRLTIKKDDGIIYLQTVEYEDNITYSNSNIIQVTIEFDDIKYYATYPLIFTTGSVAIDENTEKYLWITEGYREVMYDSDGTRGRFNGLPFKPYWLTPTGFQNIITPVPKEENWFANWEKATIKKVPGTENSFTIEPPSYFIGETTGHYIQLHYEYQNINLDTYLPIELYLNRYGMSAMNDWDGNSIQISDEGGYILSPQIGAGEKNDDNSFTGITIGEVFQDINNKEVGMFGYYRGQRSLFLDAKTGDAEFGIASKGQIKIHASDGQGTIDSGDYQFDHDGGTGKGLKIKFTSTPAISGDPSDEQGPYIKYGSGNFMVNSQGHITAQGGGTIAGWVIRDTFLRSPDEKATLYSNDTVAKMQLDNTLTTKAYTTINSNGDLINVKWNDNRATRFDIGGKFQVNEDGALKSTAGKIGGWFIESDRLFSYNTSKETLELNSKGAIYGPYWGTTNSSLYTIIGTFNSTTDPTIGESGNQAIVLNDKKNKYCVRGPETSESNIIYYYFIIQNNARVLQTETTVPTNLSYAGVVMKKPALTDKKMTIMPTLDSYVTYSHDQIVDIYLVKTRKKNSLYWEKWNGENNEITNSDKVRLGAVSAVPTTFPISIALHQDAYVEFEEITDTTKYYKYDAARKPWIEITNKIELTELTLIGAVEDETNFLTATANNPDIITITPIPTIIRIYSKTNNEILYYKDKNNNWKKTKDNTDDRIWKITEKGVAYFTDIHIRNTPENTSGSNNPNEGENTFVWTGREVNANGKVTYPTIFELTDTGSNIGGWNITGNELSSGGVHINSNGARTGGEVISVNNALKIYGSGNLATKGSLNANGGGNIGGASFGSGSSGTVSFPAGVMYFGGKKVRLVDIESIDSFSLRTSQANATVDLKVEIGSQPITVWGQDSQGGNISAGGSWDGGTFPVTGTVQYYALTGGTYHSRKGEVMATENLGTSLPFEISLDDA